LGAGTIGGTWTLARARGALPAAQACVAAAGAIGAVAVLGCALAALWAPARRAAAVDPRSALQAD
jgi:hypothetical protein